MNVYFTSKDVEQVENLSLDDDVTLTIVGKVVSLSRNSGMEIESVSGDEISVTVDGQVIKIEVGETNLNESIKKAAKRVKETQESIRVRPDIGPG